MWNAPEAMNRMWSVLIWPYFVDTVLPSTSGSRSRCTPSRDTSAPIAVLAARDLVDLVDEHDAVLLGVGQRAGAQLFLVDELAGFFFDQQLLRFLHLELARLGALAAEVREHARSCSCISSMPGGAMICTPGGNGAQVDLDLAIVRARLRAASCGISAASPGRAALGSGSVEKPIILGCGQQRVEDALLGRIRGALAHLGDLFVARHLHGDFDQVLDDGVDVAADVAHLGELGGFDFHERRVRELRQTARDLGLAAAGGTDHEDVLGRDLLAQRIVDLHAAPAIAQRDGHGALGGVLADDVLVEFGDDFACGVTSAPRSRGCDWCRCRCRRRCSATFRRCRAHRVRCSRPARAPRPARTGRRSRWPPDRARAR